MIEVAFVDQGYTGAQPAEASHAHGIRLEVVKLPTTKRELVLLPRRWVVAAASPGRPVFGVWFAITSGCPAPSLDCISCPSRSSCSHASFAWWPDMHNRL